MSLTGIKDVIDSELEGRVRQYTFRKSPTQASQTGTYFDFAMSPGMPTPKYWFDATPLVARAITQSEDGGFYHGPNVSPAVKYLRSMIVQAFSSSGTNPNPIHLLLCDYILYYPTIDDGTSDEQVMDNTVTLPRYTDGVGVQMMAVTTGARVGNQTFTIKYTNQDGVTGKVTPVLTQNNVSSIGTVTNQSSYGQNGAGPFVPLASGDTGVRAVESVTMASTDVGLFSVILVKPLCQIVVKEMGTSGVAIGIPTEKDFLVHENNLPRIYDDAFLGVVGVATNVLNTTTLVGSLKVIWK